MQSPRFVVSLNWRSGHEAMLVERLLALYEGLLEDDRFLAVALLQAIHDARGHATGTQDTQVDIRITPGATLAAAPYKARMTQRVSRTTIEAILASAAKCSCPECGVDVLLDSHYCWSCGRPLV